MKLLTSISAIALLGAATVAEAQMGPPPGGGGGPGGGKVEQSAPTPPGPVPMTQPPPQAGPEEIARLRMPLPYQVQPDNRVTFRLKTIPQASQVRVEGDWPGGIDGRTTLEMMKDPEGFWVGTTPQPLPPAVWSYRFSVDRISVSPTFGQGTPPSPLNAGTFVTPGEASVDFVPRGAPRGSSTFLHAPFMGGTKDIEVYLPAEYYSQPNRRFPVLYITTGGAGVDNGGGGESPQWLMFENMTAAGKAVPMIVVTFQPDAPGGNSLGWAQFGGAGNRTSPAYVQSADFIGTSLVKWIDGQFRTIADRDHRAIGGFSSAGAQGFLAGARHVDNFAYLFTFSGGYPTWPDVGVQIETKLDPKRYMGPDLNRIPDMTKLAAYIPNLNASAKMKLVAIWVGTNEPLIQTHEMMKKFFTERGLPLYSHENPGQVHDGRNIRISLHDLAPRLFK